MHCHVIISVFSEKPEDEMNNYKKERKKMKKKVFAAFCAAAMVLTAAGCSGGNQASSEPVEVASVEDLAELNIGVQIGTTGDSAATEAVNEDSQVNRFNKGADAIQALKNGKVDCVVIDSLPAQKFVEANDDLKIVDGIFETEEYAICMKKGNTELRDSFNEALAELKEEGTLDEIQSNYIGDEIGEHPYESPADVDRSNGTLTMATNAEFEPWAISASIPTISSPSLYSQGSNSALVAMVRVPLERSTSAGDSYGCSPISSPI